MKTYIQLLILPVLLSIILLTGCAGGGASSPVRKKMPDFNSYDGIEGAVPFSNTTEESNQGSLAFATSNVDLSFNGAMQGFVSVALPNIATDSATLSLVNTAKPIALTLLASWAQQQRHGVVIDLSSHNSEVYRTDYVLQKANDFSIPIVVMWDRLSQYRVSTLKSLIQDMPSLSLTCTSANDPTTKSAGR